MKWLNIGLLRTVCRIIAVKQISNNRQQESGNNLNFIRFALFLVCWLEHIETFFFF